MGCEARAESTPWGRRLAYVASGGHLEQLSDRSVGTPKLIVGSDEHLALYSLTGQRWAQLLECPRSAVGVDEVDLLYTGSLGP